MLHKAVDSVESVPPSVSHTMTSKSQGSVSSHKDEDKLGKSHSNWIASKQDNGNMEEKVTQWILELCHRCYQ